MGTEAKIDCPERSGGAEARQWIDVVHFDIVNSITLAQLAGRAMAKSYDGPGAFSEVLIRVNP